MRPDGGALLEEARKFWSLAWSTVRSTPHCGQRKRARPWGTLRTALQRAQGSWILVGSTPCARGAERRPGGGGAWGAGGGGGGGSEGDGGVGAGAEGGGVGEALGGEGGMSSGGRRCAMRHLGQMNSVMPGATARTPRQPAQRTWTAAAGAGEAPRPAIAEAGATGRGFQPSAWGRERRGVFRRGVMWGKDWVFTGVLAFRQSEKMLYYCFGRLSILIDGIHFLCSINTKGLFTNVDLWADHPTEKILFKRR